MKCSPQTNVFSINSTGLFNADELQKFSPYEVKTDFSEVFHASFKRAMVIQHRRGVWGYISVF